VAPLRVLMLGPLGPPHVENQALAVRDRGLEVIVGGNAPPDLADSALADAGVPISVAPDVSRSSPVGMAKTVRWTRGLIASVRPDVVGAHWVPGFGFAAAAAGAKPLAITAWGSDVYQAGRAMRLVDRVALRRADSVMADSQDLLDRCTALGADPARNSLIQWGVDLATFRPVSAAEKAERKRELGLGPGPLILSPRSLAPVYNIPTILAAFDRIGAARQDAQLVLKHMGAIRIDLPAFPHPDRVRVIGRVPYEEMVSYYQAADLVISLTSSDSSPRSIWEAMACGAPCLLSDLPWVGEHIVPERDALTVPLDASAAADAAERILGDPELSDRLARNGRALVEQHLDREVEMDRLVGVYERLAGRGAAA
jgi:glycosyltransferase involved in cell wall biosynthesis